MLASFCRAYLLETSMILSKSMFTDLYRSGKTSSIGENYYPSEPSNIVIWGVVLVCEMFPIVSISL